MLDPRLSLQGGPYRLSLGQHVCALRGASLAGTKAACLQLWAQESGQEGRGWAAPEEGAHALRRSSHLSPCSLHRVLLCNLSFVLLTSVKGSLLGFLLCTVMWRQGTQGENRVSLSRRTTAPTHDTPTPSDF